MTSTLPRFVLARTASGATVDALTLEPAAWEALKRTYAVGDLVLPCGCAAVPKTSPLGNQFFAHVGGACQTAPETQWHLAAKDLVVSTATALGYSASDEQTGRSDAAAWRADVLIRAGARTVAIEIQRSYQHLRDYQARQTRYAAGGVLGVWLLTKDGYGTLTHAMGRHRLRHEFGGRMPKRGGFYPCLAELPVAWLEFDPASVVKGAGLFEASPTEWLRAVMQDQFRCVDGAWRIG